MKKHLNLLCALATLCGANVAFAADKPTLTEVWSNICDWPGDAWAGLPTAIDWAASNDMMGTATGSRWGVGVNGKIYAVNCRTMSIMEFDADGYRDVYKLPSLAGKTITYNNTDETFSQNTIPDFYGTLISRDDAGHFIVGHGFTTGAMPCTWTVYDPASGNGKTFYKEDMGFEGVTAESFLRIDAVGRCLGDVLDYGVMWVAPTSIYWANIKSQPWAGPANVQKIQRTKIIEFQGDGTNVDAVTATGYGASDCVSLDAYLSNICQPRYNTIDEFLEVLGTDGEKAYTEGSFMYSKFEGDAFENNKYSLAMGFQAYGAKQLTCPIADLAATDLAKNYAGYSGFDTFTLGGKRYYAAFYQTKEEKYLSMMKVGIFDENGMLVAEWNNDQYVANSGRGSISAELIPGEENSAYIYVYAQSGRLGVEMVDGVGVAQLKFTADGNDVVSEPMAKFAYSSVDNVFEIEVEGNATLTLSLDNADIVNGFQTDITLPAGLAIADMDGALDVYFGEGTSAESHVLSASKVEGENKYRIVAYSSKNEVFKSGEYLLNINLVSDENLKGGEITLDNTVMSLIGEISCHPDAVTIPVTVAEPLYGDANDNGIVAIDDVVTDVQYILEKNPTPFSFKKADVNRDNVINVIDVSKTVGIILSNAPANAPRRAPGLGLSASVPGLYADVVNDAPGRKTMVVSLDNRPDITALQGDIELPEGINITGISLAGAQQGSHRVDYAYIKDNTVRFVVYSLSLARMDGNAPMIEVALECDSSATDRNVDFYNVKASDVNSNLLNFGALSVGVSNGTTTGIGEISADDEAPRYFLINGVEIKDATIPGIYIVRRGDKVEKLVIK